MIRTKRTYDPPARGDGKRILVERLWPRGMTKAALAADAWLKEVAPSTELRRWFGHQVERWDEFRRRYRQELIANRPALAPLIEASMRGTVTLLYSAHDTAHNSAVVLCEYLTEQHGRTARRSSRPTPRAKTTAQRSSAARAVKTRGTGRAPAARPRPT